MERHCHSKQQVTRQQDRYNYSTFQREVRYGSIHINISHGKWLCFRKRLFWGNKHVWELLLKYRFEEHSAFHKASCFKKGCECRFLFPFMSTTSTYIHEDKSVENEKEILWHSLDGSTREICPFIVLPKRPMGCQYINPHNSLILNVFNFNTNIQIEDVSQVFYSTLYTSKSTQEEDSEKQLQIGRAIINRMKRLLEESTPRETCSDGCNQATLEPSFCEGLCRVLSGLNAATTRNVISDTMAHLIPLNGVHVLFSCTTFLIYWLDKWRQHLRVKMSMYA